MPPRCHAAALLIAAALPVAMQASAQKAVPAPAPAAEVPSAAIAAETDVRADENIRNRIRSIFLEIEGLRTVDVGDQMSHYAVNSGVPKTLMQFLIRWCITTDQFDEATDTILEAILDTEISPELVPADASGALQSTEARIGPYALNDFFLHYVVRQGLPPSKVAFLAWHAWRDELAAA